MKRPLSLKAIASLSPEEQAIFNKNWLYDYSPLDIESGPQSDAAKQFQLETQGMIFRHIRDALLQTCRKPSVYVPTWADPFYGLYALQKGAGRMHASFVGQQQLLWGPHFRQSQIAAGILGFAERTSFDSVPIAQQPGPFDMAIVVDVLNNVPEPQPILEHLRNIVQGPMVFFSTTIMRWKVPLAFEVPASGRPWGSAFSHDKALTMAVDAGWTVVNEQRKQMPDGWPGERTLSSFLCV